jgi:uncharacterized membrane protein (TIGR02234 family)
MTSGHERQSGGLHADLRSARRQLVLTLVLGAAGAGLIFLATRQGWAQVQTIPPKPLPASRVAVTGSALVPYAEALAVAGLATLAAVLASRGLARRLTGVLLALIGASLAASAFTVSAAAAISAANSNVGPTTAGAGSVTDGSGSVTSAVPNVAGAVPHVTFSAAGWQALVVVGALAMIGAGVLVAWRADRMAVMSSRYDSPAGDGRGRGSAWRGTARYQAATTAAPADSASIWEALSRGDDPTAAASAQPAPDHGHVDSGAGAT